MNQRPNLRRLADQTGILPSYVSFDGREVRQTQDQTREAILTALGFDVATEESCAAELTRLDSQCRTRLLPPCRVVCTESGPARSLSVNASQLAGKIEWRLQFEEEQAGLHERVGTAAPLSQDHRFEITLPVEPEIGYHKIQLWLKAGQEERFAQQRLIVAPSKCFPPDDRRKHGGVWANLYTIRSPENWGIGDLRDLSTLLEKSGACGCNFILINPLHAARNRPPDISPYQPVSRLFRNFIYLDVEAVPELQHCRAAQSLLASPDFQSHLKRLRDAENVDYSSVALLKSKVLSRLHQAFQETHQGRGTSRECEYQFFLQKHEPLLTHFATFLALDEHFTSKGLKGWRAWPKEYQRPDTPQVRQFATANPDRLDYFRYVQFELDRQLSATAANAGQSGVALGVIHDLAIGTAADGFDPWLHGDLFVPGISIGAPPDDLGPQGQNWGLPPINPLKLQATGYEYWSQLLRANLAHAGGIRIDHAMGLLRQFWIPDGFRGDQGAYVAFPHNDLFAILALESARHAAVVIGEDLGTVPEGFGDLFERWGVLSTRVMYFEREDSAFRAPTRYRAHALVTVNTHDLVPLAGYPIGADLKIRRALGILRDDAELQEALRRRCRDFQELLRLLRECGFLTEQNPSHDAILQAICRFLNATPSRLAAISLDDLAGETQPVNVPGVGHELRPSWCRKMTVDLPDLLDRLSARAALKSLTGAEVQRPPD